MKENSEVADFRTVLLGALVITCRSRSSRVLRAVAYEASGDDANSGVDRMCWA